MPDDQAERRAACAIGTRGARRPGLEPGRDAAPPVRAGRARTRESGIAAVEFAIILPLMITMLVFPIFLAKILMHYSVMQKAAQNAATYFSTIPRLEMSDRTWAAEAQAVARLIVDDTVRELSPGGRFQYTLLVTCDGGGCGGADMPAQIRVEVETDVFDEFFGRKTSSVDNGKGITIVAHVAVPYLGD